jgi:hypothetical protein
MSFGEGGEKTVKTKEKVNNRKRSTDQAPTSLPEVSWTKQIKRSVGSGIEGVVSHPVQPEVSIIENPPGRLTDSPTDLNP